MKTHRLDPDSLVEVLGRGVDCPKDDGCTITHIGECAKQHRASNGTLQECSSVCLICDNHGRVWVREDRLQGSPLYGSNPYHDDDDDDDDQYCNECGGQLVWLGKLGSRNHYRCRNCGMDQSA